MIDRTSAMRLADAWWTELRVNLPISRYTLAGLVMDLASALETPHTAVRVGHALVELELTDPAVITRTATALGELPNVVAEQGELMSCQLRFPVVIGALGQGFAEALQQRTLARCDELYWQARRDALTGLPNRLRLREVLDQVIGELGPQGRIGMCFLDLDGFKAVNDRHGHGVGDRVLIVVGARLRETMVDKVSLIARLGGDEFVALIAPPVREDRVVAVSQGLLSAVQRPIQVNGRILMISASIGALSTKIGQLDADALLDAADAGLYRAKADTQERIALQVNPSQEFPALSRH